MKLLIFLLNFAVLIVAITQIGMAKSLMRLSERINIHSELLKLAGDKVTFDCSPQYVSKGIDANEIKS